jgi:hypothetical protein
MAGCSSGEGGSGKEKPGAGPSASAQERARARAASDSAGLVERYDAVLAVHPALTARLAPLRAEVARHVTAFGGAERGTRTSPSASASVAASASGSASPGVPSAPAVAVPANAKDALADLAGAERALSDLRVAALVDLPGEPARLLASVAAAGAAHAYLLTEGAR